MSSLDSEKGDKSLDEWMPPLESAHCAYAAVWVAVKNKSELSACSAEMGVRCVLCWMGWMSLRRGLTG